MGVGWVAMDIEKRLINLITCVVDKNSKHQSNYAIWTIWWLVRITPRQKLIYYLNGCLQKLICKCLPKFEQRIIPCKDSHYTIVYANLLLICTANHGCVS
jgi:hypothetical protein